MREPACIREEEVLDALGRRFIDPDLRAHLDECPECNELELVAGALLDDRATIVPGAPVPTSSTMWLRMQVRSRIDAEARAQRTLVIGQAVSLLIAIVLLGSVFGSQLLSSVPAMIMEAGAKAIIIGATALALVVALTTHLVFARE